MYFWNTGNNLGTLSKAISVQRVDIRIFRHNSFQTTAFHQSGNGLSERTEDSTETGIFEQIENSAIQESTKQKLFEMIFGC